MRLRHAVLPLALAGLLAGSGLLAGCVGSHKTRVSTGLGTVAPSTSQSPTLPPIPTDPELYARAAVQAFIDNNQPRYTQLVDPGVTVFHTISSCSGCYDMHFSFKSSSSAAGSSYCLFINKAGDELTVQLSDDLVGRGAQHAVTDGKFQPITFPNDDRAYAQEALGAWISRNGVRLSLLTAAGVSTAAGDINGISGDLRSETWQFDHDEGAAGSSYFIFSDGSGDRIAFQFSNIPASSTHHRILSVLLLPHS